MPEQDFKQSAEGQRVDGVPAQEEPETSAALTDEDMASVVGGTGVGWSPPDEVL